MGSQCPQAKAVPLNLGTKSQAAKWLLGLFFLSQPAPSQYLQVGHTTRSYLHKGLLSKFWCWEGPWNVRMSYTHVSVLHIDSGARQLQDSVWKSMRKYVLRRILHKGKI